MINNFGGKCLFNLGKFGEGAFILAAKVCQNTAQFFISGFVSLEADELKFK